MPMHHTTRARHLYRALLLLPLGLLLCACGRRETTVERGIREGILHIGNLSEPQDLDPHAVTGVTEHNIISALIEGLVTEDPRTLEPTPGVARKWEILDNGHRYRFHLRPDARWSNGDPVTAQDFAFSFRRILSPERGAPYAYMLFPLVRAEAFNKGEIDDFSQVGVQVVDPLTLELTLHTAIPHFLPKLMHQSWFPVHPDTIRKHGGMHAIDSGWTRPASFVGNGPFVLREWHQNRHISVSRNPYYWDRENLHLNGIVFYPIGDHTIEERAFRAGQLHVTGTIPVDRIEHYRLNQPDFLHIEPYLGVYYFLLNTQRPPLNDPRIRRALALSVDRERISRTITRAGEQPALHFTPPETGNYTARTKLSGSIDEARQLLAEAGFPEGHGFPSLVLLYNTADTHARIAEAVQQMWINTLGIRIQLVNMDWKVYLEQTQAGQYDIARAGWIGDYLDPETFLNLWVTDGGNNRARWSNPQYDALIRLAATTADPEQRYEAFQKAEAILIEEMPVIPLYFYRSKSLVHPAVKGWHPNVLDRHPWKHIQLIAP